jgi:Ca-activated chloride channel family protein
VPPALFIAALAGMLLAMSRPVSVVNLPSQEGTVILLMDVSGSMRAPDLAPTRLDAAKAAAIGFVEKQPAGVRIGVVAFSDNASVVQAATDDKEAVVAALNRLVTQRGTAIGRGLLTSLDAIFEEANAEAMAYLGPQTGGMGGYDPRRGSQGGPPPVIPTPQPTATPTPMPEGTYQPAIIVLLTDGQSNQGPRPLEVVPTVANRGIRVYTVGLGTEDGAVVGNQARSFRARLDEATLKAVAEDTDGEYFNATSTEELHKIYQNLSTTLVFRKQQNELTALLTAGAALMMLAAGSLSLLWFNRLP